MSKRQGSTSKGKSAAPQERSSSPLLSNRKTRDLIGAFDFKHIKLEGKIDDIIDAVNKITNHIKENRDKPPHVKQEQSTINAAPTYSPHQKQFMKDPMALHRSIHSDVEYLQFNGENYSA
ncbi:hypothetical protein PTTG_29897 [Puccinia triticina 1-1 BBBD Race 1]|uniref:Uncharacterized protein n=1 Tax=Puccinia triticina (isolate 1-1 / race 1 (BBBD)) TaxID=630390 RepID=A0A180G184_PUCT1|nr:hypothetical protein PTTG_29897 [Puccinia triticina 1-1 BBBD Race 1]